MCNQTEDSSALWKVEMSHHFSWFGQEVRVSTQCIWWPDAVVCFHFHHSPSPRVRHLKERSFLLLYVDTNWKYGGWIFSFLLKCKAFMPKPGTKNLMPNVASFSFSRCCCHLPVDSRYTCPGFSSLKADSWMSSFTVTYVSMSEIRRMGGQAEISREELRCHEKSV